MPATASNESTPPTFKSCVIDCVTGKTKKSKYYATKFERVFEADPNQEQINCLCRVSFLNCALYILNLFGCLKRRRVSDECKNSSKFPLFRGKAMRFFAWHFFVYPKLIHHMYLQ